MRYDFSYIAGWLNGRYRLRLSKEMIERVLDPAFVFERRLMETDPEYPVQKVQYIRREYPRWKIVGEPDGVDEWPDENWGIWLMNRLDVHGICPPFGTRLAEVDSLAEAEMGAARSKMFHTHLQVAPIDATAAKVTGLEKRPKH